MASWRDTAWNLKVGPRGDNYTFKDLVSNLEKLGIQAEENDFLFVAVEMGIIGREEWHS